MPTKWNPSDKDVDVVLSNNNLTASILHPATGSVRSTTSKTTGKWYLEYIANWTTTNAHAACGIMQAGASLLGGVGADATGWGTYNGAANNWFTVNNGGPNNIGGTGVSGDVIGFCLDLNANKFYLTKNGANLLGDPVAGTGGQTIAAGTWFAACGCAPAFDETAVMTASFGATTFANGPPTGFTAWDTSPFIYKSFDTPIVSIARVSQPVGT